MLELIVWAIITLSATGIVASDDIAVTNKDPLIEINEYKPAMVIVKRNNDIFLEYDFTGDR